jgi:O-methyltransferase
MVDTGYPASLLHYVEGMVEETLPKAAPERIALLRLDTDWYESTRHELIHLYPASRVARFSSLTITGVGKEQGRPLMNSLLHFPSRFCCTELTIPAVRR